MPVAKDKASIATVVSKELKQRIQRVAELKKWTISQTVKECLEEFMDVWEEELGISTKSKDPVPKTRKSKPQ
jgi:uncharacterized protein (UPF0335 family)